ncbi:MAG TPA: large conductance mechanosensitive channel protein MscL [Actinomycetota bacterium]|nr:large conductance mechanosensitive channel protein MscL [Actinomycetota bacterium]
MLKEFKKFALRGNVVELAVAVILGLAFNAVVQSFVNDILMALIGGLFGVPNFAALTVQVGEAIVTYGVFLNAVVNFLLIAFALFLIVKAINRMMGAREEPPKMAECPFCKTSVPVNATKCPACTSQLAGQPA